MGKPRYGAFTESKCPVEDRLEHFTKYIRRQKLARLLVQTELFRKVLHVKGSIVECGVHHGGGVMAWAKLSATLEPYNYRRTIVGFDTFEGFPTVHANDGSASNVATGNFAEPYDVADELRRCVQEFDEDRYLSGIPKVDLVKGDANVTIPDYLTRNPHLLVSLLYLDFDIYEPTVTALHNFLPRMPKGAILAFDEVHNANWPGETLALLESLQLGQHRLECAEYEPNISWIQL
jgi:hypothetical protein